MQVDSILPNHIQQQLQDPFNHVDPLESYIHDLLDVADVQPLTNNNWQCASTIIASQELDPIEAKNQQQRFTHCLQLLRLLKQLEKESLTYKRMLNKVDHYFNAGQLQNETLN